MLCIRREKIEKEELLAKLRYLNHHNLSIKRNIFLAYSFFLVIVHIPAKNEVRGAANELRKSSDRHKTLPNNLFLKAHFSDQLTDLKGGIIQKPKSWSIE